MWNRSSTYQRFYSNFKERHHHKRKLSQGVKSEKFPPRRSTLGKISVRYEFIRIMWFFWRSSRGCKNCIFSWKSIWTDISDWVWRNIFCRLFSRSFTPQKNPADTQSMKIQVKLGEIPAARMLEKLCKT